MNRFVSQNKTIMVEILDEAFETEKKEASKRSIHRDARNRARRRELGDHQYLTKAACTIFCR